MRLRHKTHGQAIVEFALAATLIFFLMAAAIDLGLIFLTRQALLNASAEGANYGTLPQDETNFIFVNGNREKAINEVAVRQRVRQEAGIRSGTAGVQPDINSDDAIGGMRAINLLDLNSNGINDANEPGVIEDRIRISLLDRNRVDPCPRNSGPPIDRCYLKVEVTATYRPFFVLSPVLGEEVPIRASTIQWIDRGGFTQGGPQTAP
jgi:hypothetical protein